MCTLAVITGVRPGDRLSGSGSSEPPSGTSSVAAPAVSADRASGAGFQAAVEHAHGCDLAVRRAGRAVHMGGGSPCFRRPINPVIDGSHGDGIEESGISISSNSGKPSR